MIVVGSGRGDHRCKWGLRCLALGRSHRVNWSGLNLLLPIRDIPRKMFLALINIIWSRSGARRSVLRLLHGWGLVCLVVHRTIENSQTIRVFLGLVLHGSRNALTARGIRQLCLLAVSRCPVRLFGIVSRMRCHVGRPRFGNIVPSRFGKCRVNKGFDICGWRSVVTRIPLGSGLCFGTFVFLSG